MQQWTSGLCLQAEFHLIGVLCRQYGKKTAKMSQFRPSLQIWGSCVFTNMGQIWQQTVDPWSTLTWQISFESVYCVTFQGQKLQFGTNFNIWGLLYPAPFTEFGVLEQTQGIRVCAKFHLYWFIVALWRQKTPNFAVCLDFSIF